MKVVSLTADDIPEDVDEFITKILKMLPEDGMFVDCFDTLFRQKIQFSSNGNNYFADSYYILVASKEWPVIEDASILPELGLEVYER